MTTELHDTDPARNPAQTRKAEAFEWLRSIATSDPLTEGPALHAAILMGEILRLRLGTCGPPAAPPHHPNYSKHLEAAAAALMEHVGLPDEFDRNTVIAIARGYIPAVALDYRTAGTQR